MAWDEWEQLKADAAQSGSTGMQLNQLAADGGGGGGGGAAGDLVVNQDDLGAVGHDAFALYEALQTATDIAGAGMNKDGAGSTMQAAASLKSHGFAMGSALELTVEVWTSQAKTVLQACAHISNHLDYSKKLHAEDDAKIAAVLASRDGSAESVSELSKYFK
ncbi:hypothetical protein ADK57_45140 [Streptomyces sp. MMG1533]|uniref:hypothetical protein n=1 Tax=Streptomyces sp. MMG1533 TaxID=1415546 RepID=UPI0006AEACC8|nr:hypothetical protein [Streptomyces sp. MMG1533]KOU55239.1 hypothetical protein ADK57_45140 [Streptomyces sp. MMG1533]